MLNENVQYVKDQLTQMQAQRAPTTIVARGSQPALPAKLARPTPSMPGAQTLPGAPGTVGGLAFPGAVPGQALPGGVGGQTLPGPVGGQTLHGTGGGQGPTQEQQTQPPVWTSIVCGAPKQPSNSNVLGASEQQPAFVQQVSAPPPPAWATPTLAPRFAAKKAAHTGPSPVLDYSGFKSLRKFPKNCLCDLINNKYLGQISIGVCVVQSWTRGGG